MTKEKFLKNLWRWKCGLPEHNITEKKLNYKELMITERSKEFEALKTNRMVMGAFRYGKLGESGKRQYDRIGSAKQRLELYEKTGNLEHLVDVANLMEVEFVEGKHPLKHFASIDDGVHAKEKRQ